jgi:DNA-binding IclR family transcriptional regulator
MRRLDGFARNATSDWWADILARRTGESVWIGELVRDQVHIFHQAIRPEDLVQDLGADGTIPWYACALGHALVGGLDHAAREALLALPASRLTGMTITDGVRLRQMLALTRDRGYAVDAHGATLGDAGIAAPVFDSSRRVVAAVGIVGAAERLLSPQHQPDLIYAVRVTAQALSKEASSGTPKDS